MTTTVQILNGRWTINGKSYKDCNFIERRYFQLYLNSFKNQEILIR